MTDLKQKRRCNEDGCDAGHCIRCGGHMLQWYGEGRTCDECMLEIDGEGEMKQGVQEHE